MSNLKKDKKYILNIINLLNEGNTKEAITLLTLSVELINSEIHLEELLEQENLKGSLVNYE